MQAEAVSPSRVVFIGAECTGKTTLIDAISRKIGAPYSKEFVREYADKIGRPLEARDLDPIARGQLGAEDQAADAANRIVLHDTNLLSSILYAEHYFSVHIPWVDEIFLEREYALYFLCMPDIPWEADPGQRVSPEERTKLHSRFQAILARHRIEPIALSGPLDQRIQTVLSALRSIR